MKPLLSLILATLGREAELECCLSSMLLDGQDDFEVIIVDQNSNDRAREIVERFQNDLHIVYLQQKVPAASSARNLGAVHARGEWIGFPDDDARFRPETLATLRRHIAPGAYDVLTGMTCDEAGDPSVLPWRQTETDLTTRFLRCTLAESTLFLRRELFVQCNGFDPLFGPGGAFGAEEAIDLIRRLQVVCPVSRMHYFPEIRLIHANASPFRDEASLRKARGYARARGACFARHWRSASKWRILSEVSRHIIGSVVLRGLRRRSRVDCLLGYIDGFRAYRALQYDHAAMSISWQPASSENA